MGVCLLAHKQSTSREVGLREVTMFCTTYDESVASRRPTRALQMFGGEGGGVDPGNEDSDSSTTSSKAARNWNSDDDLSMGGGKVHERGKEKKKKSCCEHIV